MNYSTNYNLNKPERSEQFNIDHWNNNTDTIDTQMHTNEVNIAQNATDIATLFTGLNTKNTSDTDSVFYKLMKLIYPVGSLYWSANNTNPNTLFGGTWTQIKDKFVLACGDTYSTTGATGGASSVTLAVTNLPSHNHSIGGSTGVTQPTFVGDTSTTSDNNRGHTHNFEHKHTTGGMSENETHSHSLRVRSEGGEGSKGSLNFLTGKSTSSSNVDLVMDATNNYAMPTRIAHTHTTNSLTNASGTAITNTGAESQNHTHTYTPSGNVSAHSHTLPTNTGSKGDGTAFSIMPPYVVKYCWQRTA